MKSFYILLLALAVSAVSCRTKEGEPGPAGESNLNKQGSVSGTITYTNDNGNDTTTTFNHQYFESLEDNKFSYEDYGQTEYYSLNFKRRDLKDANNYLSFDVNGEAANGIEDDPYSGNVYFSLYTVINNDLYYFYDDGEIELTNVIIDHTTGRVTFDFSGTIYYDGGSATVAGKADVILNRLRVNIQV